MSDSMIKKLSSNDFNVEKCKYSFKNLFFIFLTTCEIQYSFVNYLGTYHRFNKQPTLLNITLSGVVVHTVDSGSGGWCF